MMWLQNIKLQIVVYTLFKKKLLCLLSYTETLRAKSQVQHFYIYSKKQAHKIIMLTMKMISGFVNNLNIERKIKSRC